MNVGRSAILRGGLLAGVTIAVGLALPTERAYELLAFLLALAAGVYVGFGIADASAGEVRLQWLVALLFICLAALGLWISPLLLAAGWMLHAGWDWLHHGRVLRTRAPGGYPALCAVYDVIVGLFVLVLFAFS